MNTLKKLALATSLALITALPATATADDNRSVYYDGSTNVDVSRNDNRYFDYSSNHYDNSDRSIHSGRDSHVGNTVNNNTTVNKAIYGADSVVQQAID